MTDKKITNTTENKKNLYHVHDKAFKSAMSDLRVARDFLQHHLPTVVQEKIDLRTLKLHQTTFIDPELRRLMSDMLYSADFKDEEKQAFLYLAVDHQSTPDALMAFRMLKYTSRIIDQYLKENDTTVLPVVIPLVVYNGNTKYPYSCSLFDFFGADKALAERFMFTSFELVDLNQIPDWVHSHLSPPLEDKTMTLAEQLRREGIQQGVQQGMQQGMQRGKLEGEQTILMELLNHRFPRAGTDYEQRIKNARGDDLLSWGKKILSAKSVDEVFEG